MTDTMPLLRTAYWDDPVARRSFKDFIRAIHGLDFTAWEGAGYWDDDYRPYSYFVGERLVASLCVYSMAAVVSGEPCRVAQVSGVGTLPEYRRRGLNRRLHEIALAAALPSHRFAFLYADREAVPFYRRCAFRPAAAHGVRAPLPPVAGDPAVEKLDVGDAATRDALYALACARAPSSKAFATLTPKLVMFHLLHRLRDHAWRVPALDAVVLMKREEARVVVYDVLARTMPRFEQLAPFLAALGAREAEFRFPVDELHVPSSRPFELADHDVHVMGGFDLGPRPVLPFTSQA